MPLRGCQLLHRSVHGWAVGPCLLEVRVCEPEVGQRRDFPDLGGEGTGPDAAHA